jgi:hypothetical protein
VEGQNGSHPDANNGGAKVHKALVNSGVCHGLAESVAGCQLERVKGFEPSASNSQAVESQPVSESAETPYTQIRAQIAGDIGRDLSQVVGAWPSLPGPLRAAILAIINSASDAKGAP